MDALPSMADAPFHCPAEAVLDLPAPLSVNRLRRLDYSACRDARAWVHAADNHVFVAKRRLQNRLQIELIQRFEVEITFDENQTKIDLDNGVKLVIDYLKRIALIVDDSPKHMRKLTVSWGVAPEGTRVLVRSCT